MADVTQAIYLENALRALDQRDRPALFGNLASLDVATLDHIAAVLAHPVWDVLLGPDRDRLTLDLPRLMNGES
jgi:L-alanine-DL-glutamate epimerase-like enolase superfamily enzyme